MVMHIICIICHHIYIMYNIDNILYIYIYIYIYIYTHNYGGYIPTYGGYHHGSILL